MPKTLINVDIKKSPQNQPFSLHNRWHPDIPPIIEVKSDDIFRIECLDWTGGQVKDNNSAEDIKNIDLTQVHYLSGPIAINKAKPGDLLVVDILDIGPLENSQWGFTGIFAKENGGGFLTEYFPKAHKAIWNFEGIYATSRHIKGVKLTQFIHAGLIGCAPSHELLRRWNKRELELVKTNPSRVPPLAELPNPKGALMGTMQKSKATQAVKEAARTIPPRENGGNCDIKNLSKGSRIYFPVFVDGANLSVGDIHFSQGDGEISFCGGIEMAGWIDLKVNVIKNGMQKHRIFNPIFETGPVEPKYSRYLVFEGISVDKKDKQYYLDAHISYKQSCLNAIEYLKQFGYTGQQAYLLLSCAAIEGRISGIVDFPNACCTLALPTEIFDFDIRPHSK